MKQLTIYEIVEEICEFGCNECCMEKGSERCLQNLEDYVKRIKEAKDFLQTEENEE